jgi:hypothetical protein
MLVSVIVAVLIIRRHHGDSEYSQEHQRTNMPSSPA